MRRALVAIALVLVLVPALAQAQGEQARLVWSERVGADAEAVLVIRDIEGRQLMALRSPVDAGAQTHMLDMPPLPRAAATVQAGLVEDARVTRQSPIRALGDRSANGPELTLRASLALAFHDLWDCAEGGKVQVTWQVDGALVQHPAGTWPLRPNPDPDAAPDDDSVQLRTSATTATITLPGIGTLDCLPALFRPVLPIVAEGTVTAGDGTGWRVEVSPEQALIDLPGLEDETLSTAGLTASAPRDGVIRLSGGGLSLSLRDAPCRRAGIDMPYPVIASVVASGVTGLVQGCAGNPLALIDGQGWTVASIFGVPLTATDPAKIPEITLQIAGAQIAGRGTCNRYLGAAHSDGGALSFTDLGTTRLACPQHLRNLELRFLDALEVATGFDLSRDGMLILRAGPVPVLTARRP